MFASAAYYNNWDLWRLYHKVVFDGENRIIRVSEGVTSLDIKKDIYSDWKEWSRISDNAYWPSACRSIGGDVTVQGQRAGDIYFLENNWKLFIDITQVKVTGALFSDNFDTAYHDLKGVPVFPAEVASLVTTQEVASSNPTLIADAVWQDPGADNLLGKVVELWQLAGLGTTAPVTITDNSISFGTVTISIGQPDEASTTLTRS